MEAARTSRPTVVLSALAVALAAAALWASIALAGGSSSPASTPSSPGFGQVAFTQNEQPSTPAAPGEDCPDRGGGSEGDGSSGSGTGSSV
jgi:hypothetical protein